MYNNNLRQYLFINNFKHTIYHISASNVYKLDIFKYNSKLKYLNSKFMV